jgi:hypothetical protein
MDLYNVIYKGRAKRSSKEKTEMEVPKDRQNGGRCEVLHTLYLAYRG